jgi:ABC-2 type transport system permease protein
VTAYWNALRWSSWLGWRIDSNWTSVWLFVFYVLLKPLAGSLLLVCMYWAAQEATGGDVGRGFLPFAYVSSACFMVIGGVTFGMSNAVIADRENYGMLKFIRICPVSFRAYLVGRGLSRAGQAFLGAALTLAVGIVGFDEIRAAVGESGVQWGWLAFFVAVGIVMQIALGLILASAVLNMARYGAFLSEGVAGVLLLLSGAAFPIDRLPDSLYQISFYLPTTYWLEGMRRSLIGDGLASSLDAWPTEQLALALAASTAVLCVVAHFFFYWSERRAWRLGRFDEVSGN